MFFLTPIGSDISADAGNGDEIRAIEKEIASDLERIATERPAAVIDRIAKRGRLTAQCRVERLCDNGSQIWYLGEYQGFERAPKDQHKPWRLGVICAIGEIKGRRAAIIANDNTITAGAWHPGTPEKIQRAQKLALRLGLPVFYLVECAGLYLPDQDKSFAGATGAGAIFELQAQLNRAGLLQVAAVFGDCIAGGGYMPLLADKIVMTEQSTICIGGNALNASSKGSQGDRLGGPDIHVHISGCAEERVMDDNAAIEKLREWAGLMPSPADEYYRMAESIDSPYPIDDLYKLIPTDISRSYSISQVIARLVDGGQVQVLHKDTGNEVFTALALIDGLAVVLIANNPEQSESYDDHTTHAGSILYKESIIKMRQVCEDAREDGIPVIWLQDVAGFDIGYEAERQGLLKYGAMMLRELSSDQRDDPPHLCILLRKASGAGYYAMKGAPFHPAWIAATALTHLEVMAPETLADTLYHKKLQALDNSPQSDTKRAAIETARSELIARQSEASKPQSAAIRGDVDCIVPLDELRNLMITFVHSAYQSTIHHRKPQRLWSTGNCE